jgi:hypothetical protein
MYRVAKNYCHPLQSKDGNSKRKADSIFGFYAKKYIRNDCFKIFI